MSGKEYGNGGTKVTVNLPQPLIGQRNPTTAKKLSDIADVSEKTYRMGAKILNSDDVIETNIRQRGIGNPNPIKLGKCIKELDRIYGIQRGGDRHQSENISFCKTQEDLANVLGLDVRTLHNYKKLTELVPELQDWVETGILAPTTALAIVKELSAEEQKI